MKNLSDETPGLNDLEWSTAISDIISCAGKHSKQSMDNQLTLLMRAITFALACSGQPLNIAVQNFKTAMDDAIAARRAGRLISTTAERIN